MCALVLWVIVYAMLCTGVIIGLRSYIYTSNCVSVKTIIVIGQTWRLKKALSYDIV